jgi:hypothetical protein
MPSLARRKRPKKTHGPFSREQSVSEIAHPVKQSGVQVVIQFGKISHGVYPEYAERVRDNRPAFLFVISSGCEKFFPVIHCLSKPNCITAARKTAARAEQKSNLCA